MSIIFGNLTQSFVTFGTAVQNLHDGKGTQADVDVAAAHFRHTAADDAAILVYIGLGILVATFTYMFFWVYTGEVNSKRLRERYLQAVLRQDIAYFDNVGAGEVASRIQTDTRTFNHFILRNEKRISTYTSCISDLVQQGSSEKVAIVIQFLAAFITGFVVAYVRSWRLALALTSILPCIAITGGIMNKIVSKYMQYVSSPFNYVLN